MLIGVSVSLGHAIPWWTNTIMDVFRIPQYTIQNRNIAGFVWLVYTRVYTFYWPLWYMILCGIQRLTCQFHVPPCQGVSFLVTFSRSTAEGESVPPCRPRPGFPAWTDADRWQRCYHQSTYGQCRRVGTGKLAGYAGGSVYIHRPPKVWHHFG